MRCEAAVTMMPDRVRGELATAAEARLAQHMESCEACREEFALLRAVANARPEPPPELEARIQRALRNQNAPPSLVDPTNDSTGRSSRPRRLRVSHPGLAAAAVVFLALGTAAVWPQIRARMADRKSVV